MNNDLISREALKEEVNNRFDNSAYFPFRFLELIDNAPTVEPCYQNASCLDCKNYDKENHNCPRFCEVIIETAKEIERPKGEWIAREDMDFLDENKVIHNHFMCEKCGFIHDFIDGHTSQYNFCPQCGTQLFWR